MLTRQEAIKELIEYSKEIKKIVENAKQNNKRQEKVYKHRKFFRFEYDGHRTGHRTYQTNIKNWDYLIYPTIWKCRDSRRIRDVEANLRLAIPVYSGGYLLSYVSRLVHLLFRNKTNGMYSINNIAKAFVKHILDEPVKYRLISELEGIVIPPRKIKLGRNLMIRRITKRDLERKLPIESYENFNHATEKATVKFELNFEEKESEHLVFSAVDAHLVPLRLFKLGNIQHVSIREDAESVESTIDLDDVGYFNRVFVGISYLLKQKEVEKLKEFYKVIIKKISPKLYLSWLQNGPISIAYSRYIEALERGRTVEKGLAYAVMGLEALLLDGDDEINYRLKMRTARLFQILSLDAKSAFDDLSWAYDARSAYAHGNKLKPKEIRKIRTEYGHENILILKVLDYLRILIAVSLIGDMEKKDLIRNIDDSWLSDSSLKKLKKSYAKVAKLMNLKKHNPEFLFFPANHISNMTI